MTAGAARKHELISPNDRRNDPSVRAGQQRHIAEFLTKYEAEHGPLDPQGLAAVNAQLAGIDAKLAKAESEA